MEAINDLARDCAFRNRDPCAIDHEESINRMTCWMKIVSPGGGITGLWDVGTCLVDVAQAIHRTGSIEKKTNCLTFIPHLNNMIETALFRIEGTNSRNHFEFIYVQPSIGARIQPSFITLMIS
jgi:hypothetical protein